MMPPEHVLRALSDLLAKNQSVSPASPDIFRSIFATANGQWTGVIRKPNSVDWFVRPLFPIRESVPVNSETSAAESSHWVEIPAFANSIGDLPNQGDSPRFPLLRDVLTQACIVQRGTDERVWCVPCESLQLVAGLLQEAGPPPNLVVQDWKKQLASMDRTRSSPSPAETLVTEDGELVPLPETIGNWTTVDRHAEHSPRLAAHWEMRSASWPWSISSPRLAQGREDAPTQGVAWLNSPDKTGALPVSPRPKQKKRNPPQRVVILTAVAGTLGLAILAWMSSNAPPPGAANRRATTGAGLGGASERIDTVSSSTAESPEWSTDDQELTTLEDLSAKAAERSSATETDTIESLLAQLQPPQSSTLQLGSLDTSSIISEALQSGSVPNHVPNSDEIPPFGEKIAMLDDNNSVEGDNDEDPSQIATNLLNQGELNQDGMPLEKTLTTASFNKKEILFIGHPVQPKLCRCEVKLTLPKELVVEPTEQVSIAGVDKASWKIAIEDEEPELILEIRSKPGSRWQISTAVGLRVTSASPPILLAPRDAQTVCNRLVDYHQWITNSIAALENAKANSISKSRIDFYGEIKKRERQQREVEKAIAQWKTIAKLSHLFFDGNEVHLTFIPMRQE